MKRLVVFYLLITGILPVMASTYTQPANVTSISLGTGWARVKTDAMIPAESCTEQTWYRLDFTTGTEAMYSTILAAKMAGQKIHFALTGCTGNMPKITYVDVCETANCVN